MRRELRCLFCVPSEVENMAKRKITINIPVDLISNLQELGVTNVNEFLETLFNEVDAEDLLALLEGDGFWDYDEEEFDEEEEEDF
jgi:hypothetical protein